MACRFAVSASRRVENQAWSGFGSTAPMMRVSPGSKVSKTKAAGCEKIGLHSSTTLTSSSVSSLRFVSVSERTAGTAFWIAA